MKLSSFLLPGMILHQASAIAKESLHFGS